MKKIGGLLIFLALITQDTYSQTNNCESLRGEYESYATEPGRPSTSWCSYTKQTPYTRCQCELEKARAEKEKLKNINVTKLTEVRAKNERLANQYNALYKEGSALEAKLGILENEYNKTEFNRIKSLAISKYNSAVSKLDQMQSTYQYCIAAYSESVCAAEKEVPYSADKEDLKAKVNELRKRECPDPPLQIVLSSSPSSSSPNNTQGNKTNTKENTSANNSANTTTGSEKTFTQRIDEIALNSTTSTSAQKASYRNYMAERDKAIAASNAKYQAKAEQIKLYTDLTVGVINYIQIRKEENRVWREKQAAIKRAEVAEARAEVERIKRFNKEANDFRRYTKDYISKRIKLFEERKEKTTYDIEGSAFKPIFIYFAYAKKGYDSYAENIKYPNTMEFKIQETAKVYFSPVFGIFPNSNGTYPFLADIKKQILEEHFPFNTANYDIQFFNRETSVDSILVSLKAELNNVVNKHGFSNAIPSSTNKIIFLNNKMTAENSKDYWTGEKVQKKDTNNVNYFNNQKEEQKKENPNYWNTTKKKENEKKNPNYWDTPKKKEPIKKNPDYWGN